MPRKTPPQLAAPSVENQTQEGSAPNRFRKRALRRQLVRYGVFLGGAAALLWIVYADRSLIGGRDMYYLTNVNPRISEPAIPASELANAANLRALIERASVTRPEPAMDKSLSFEAGAAMTGNSAVATARAMVQSSKLGSPSGESKESPPLDVPSESVNSSLPIYRTVRQILLREEPRFGAAAEIMLDRGARLIVLEINGRWLKVKMEDTGAPGFVREEFVVPASAAGPWSPTGKPVAPSNTPVGRNPEQEPPAKAGARVEGSSASKD